MNRILLEAHEVTPHGLAVLTGPRARHLIAILKVTTGDQVRIGLVNGPRGTGTVDRIEKDSLQLECTFEAQPDPRPQVDLILALPRPKVMKRLWPQLATLGVNHIHLIETWKVEKPYWASHVLREEFYVPLLIEGLQQGGHTALPNVSLHNKFKPFVEDELPSLTKNSFALGTDPNAEHRLLDALRERAPAQRLLLAVGPEGGWTPFEQEQLQGYGFHWARLGPRILRTDTACISLLGTFLALNEPAII